MYLACDVHDCCKDIVRTFVVLGAGGEGVVVKVLEFRLNAGFGGLDILSYVVKVSLYC